MRKVGTTTFVSLDGVRGEGSRRIGMDPSAGRPPNAGRPANSWSRTRFKALLKSMNACGS
jgi:hypothetical protein